MKDFFDGFFSIFNIWGSDVNLDDIELDTSKAIKNDWEKIAQDIQVAVDTVKNEYFK